MNWLAHLALSPRRPAGVRLGNVCGDFFSWAERQALPPGLRRGVALHLAIDAFTDAHPGVARARDRFSPPLRRVAGLLVDVAFDHLLARAWSRWMPDPLARTVGDFYRLAASPAARALPPHVRDTLRLMADQDWLGSYATWSGIELTLWRMAARMSPRLSRRCPMEEAPERLHALLPALEEDFAAFWPEVRAAAPGFLSSPAPVTDARPL